jgi:hypothetical protein
MIRDLLPFDSHAPDGTQMGVDGLVPWGIGCEVVCCPVATSALGF